MGIFEKFKIGFKKSASTFTSGLRDIIIKKETEKKKWGHARQAGLLGSPLPFIGYRKR